MMSNLRGAAGRDQETGRFERLFREQHAAVVAYVRRRVPEEAVDDVVEETFLVAWRRLDRVPAAERAWLLGVARNVIATQRRGAGRRQALALRLGQMTSGRPVAHTQPEPPQALDPRLAGALDKLSDKDREALTLIAWDGLEPSQAALVLGDSPGAFRVRLHRARRRLRRLLEERPPRTNSESRLRVEEIAHD